MADVNQNPIEGQTNQQNTDTNGQTTNQQNADNGGTETNQEVTVESLMAEIAQLKADGAKNKTALDKALKENGEVKKALRAKQTAEEQEAEAKKEADEQQKAYIADLEKFKRTAEAKARYALQGMSEELAIKAAEAEISGDMDALATIQKQNTETLIKQHEVEWLKSRPQPQAGNGGNGDETEDAFLKGFNSVGNKYIQK
jgi:VIT1/CCC1 family predicted Fe2+/Mn2+ transporter